MDKEHLFELTIIGPYSQQDLSIIGIEIESPTGSFFVGYDHIPLISLIKNKSTITYYLPDRSCVRTQVNGGVFNITRNKALIVLNP